MIRATTFLLMMLFSLTAFAAEKVKGTNFYSVDQENWQTGEKSGYWMWHGRGVSRSLEGPLETTTVECHAAGFWDAEGSWGEGICVHTSGEDTFTSHSKRDKGQELGQWKMLSGTGQFAGLSGQGTYKLKQLSETAAMSDWEGEVTLAE